MANFNPSPGQTQDPNYWYWSKPIQTPESDKSGMYTWKTAGDAIENAAKAGDSFMKQHIDDEVQNKVDISRDMFTGQLEGATGAAETYGTTALPFSGADPNSGGAALDRNQLPDELKNLGNRVDTLKNAKSLRADMNTYYDAQLRNIAKDLRSRYPGYRDFIDQKFHAALSYNIPANSYLRSLMQLMESNATNGQKDWEATVKSVRDLNDAGNPQAPAMMQEMRQNPGSADVMRRATEFVNQQNAVKYRVGQHEQARKNAGYDAEDRKDIAIKQAGLITNNSFNQYWTGALKNFGINSPQDIDAFITKQASSGDANNIKGKDLMALGMQLQANGAAFEQDMRRQFTTPDPDTHRTLMDDMGGRQAMEEHIQAYKKHWDTTASLLTDQHLGMLGMTKRMSDEVVNGAELGLLTQKDFGDKLANMDALRRIAPQDADKVFQQILGDSKLTDKLKTYVGGSASDIMAQPDFAKNGIIKTYQDAVKEMKSKGIKLPAAYNSLIDTVNLAFEPNTDKKIRSNILSAMFSPGNDHLLRQFKEDQKIGNVTYPGYNSLYSKLGSDNAVAAVKGVGDNDMWNNYVSWMGKSFGDILQPELNQLNNMEKQHYLVPRWSSESHQWEVFVEGDKSGRNILLDNKPVPPMALARQMGSSAVAQQYVENYQQTVNKLNAGIRSLGNVVKADNGNIDSVVLQHMFNAGLNPDQMVRVEGIPNDLVQSIIKSRGKSGLMFEKGAENMAPVAPLQ